MTHYLYWYVWKLYATLCRKVNIAPSFIVCQSVDLYCNSWVFRVQPCAIQCSLCPSWVLSFHLSLQRWEKSTCVVSTEEMVSVNVHLCMASRTHLSYFLKAVKYFNSILYPCFQNSYGQLVKFKFLMQIPVAAINVYYKLVKKKEIAQHDPFLLSVCYMPCSFLFLVHAAEPMRLSSWRAILPGPLVCLLLT